MAVTSCFRAAWLALALTGAAAATEMPAAPTAADMVTHGLTVTMDQARVVRLPARVATLVIGNPLIADAAVQNGGLMVLTGKGIGSTNLIALDARGEQLMSVQIRVRPQNDAVVQVYRGVERETYSCTPTCERTVAIANLDVAPTGVYDMTIGLALQSESIVVLGQSKRSPTNPQIEASLVRLGAPLLVDGFE